MEVLVRFRLKMSNGVGLVLLSVNEEEGLWRWEERIGERVSVGEREEGGGERVAGGGELISTYSGERRGEEGGDVVTGPSNMVAFLRCFFSRS